MAKIVDEPWDEITARYWHKVKSGEMTIREVYEDYDTMGKASEALKEVEDDSRTRDQPADREAQRCWRFRD